MTERLDDGRSAGGDIQAVDRTAHILRLFTPETPELTAADAAERLDLNRTTVYRYCTSMVSAGLLERGTTSGTFIPGALLLQLGAFALGRRKVIDLAPPVMRELCLSTGLTAVLSLWGPTGPVVSRVEEDSTRSVLVTVRVGAQLSLQTAQAKVFLTYLADQLQVDRLLGVLPDQQRRLIRRELDTAIPRDGVSMTPDGRGVHAVAAPIFDEYGICAALALVATEQLLPLDAQARDSRRVRESAEALTKALGGTNPPPP